MSIFPLINYIFIIILLLVFILMIIMTIKSKKNCNYPKKSNIKNPHFAVLIPARDESRVIKGLLDSIKNQTFKIDMRDVYVIVESKEDKTCQIVESYNANIVMREDLSLQRKGYALDDAIKYILSIGKKYDAYFIFDADNVLDKDFFLKMNETFQNGYDIGVGYRNTKNGNDNVVSACSTLTFSMINTLGNNIKNRDTRNITVSGTGFYIRGNFIEQWGGYPFHSLTEDYELTLYSSVHEMTSFYNDEAIFYDEQPTSFKVSLTQRTRWIKGFFEARKTYVKELYHLAFTKGKNNGSQFSNALGILPYLLLVIAFVLEIFTHLIGSIYYAFINKNLAWILFKQFVGLILICYVVLLLLTAIIIFIENKQFNLTLKSKIKALFFNPIFLATYVYCALKALFKKDVGWVKIEHGAIK